MICPPCKDINHPECLGKLWCDCQHETALQPSEPTLGWGNALRGPF